jgi:hypothetical protein
MEAEENESAFAGGPGPLRRSSGLPPPSDNQAAAPITPPGTSLGIPNHSRTRSFGQSSMHSTAFGTPGAVPTGTANFTIVSASGYPPASNIMVYMKQLGHKTKVIHKTDHIKSPSGTVSFNDRKESFKCACSADTQFQVQVKGHNTFGSDDDLGEGLFFVDESGTGQEKQVRAGSGHVVIKSNFILTPEEGGSDSPRGGIRRSFLSKKEPSNGRTSRDITPTPGS